jgi:hypothetical protein
MKVISSLWRRHYVARTSGFLIAVALTVGMVGCAEPAVPSYDLIIAGGAGGSVTIPGEGTYAYDEGTSVDLVATPDPGYEFVNWTGDVSTIDDVDDATTAVVVDKACFVMANFAREQYDLTVTGMAGGSIIMPGEGAFVYDAGTVVNLVAEAQEGYKFVNWTGDVSNIGNPNAAETTISVDDSYSVTANFESKYTPMVAGGAFHTVGLKIDGTVVAAGYNEYGELVVSDWMDIVQVLAGTYHTVGLKADGTVVTVGWCVYQQCAVDDWTDIIQVSGSYYHTLGLRSGGSVVAVGSNDYRQCDVGGWTDIVQVGAGCRHTVGLKSDGSVVAAGSNDYGQCDLGGWADIIQVAAGCLHTVGLRSDGTVVSTGWDDFGGLDVGGWTGIVQVAAGYRHTVGLRSDGTVVAVGDNASGQCDVGDWTGIVQVAAGYDHTLGLRSDGSVVAVGSNGWLQCEVGDWDLR